MTAAEIRAQLLGVAQPRPVTLADGRVFHLGPISLRAMTEAARLSPTNPGAADAVIVRETLMDADGNRVFAVGDDGLILEMEYSLVRDLANAAIKRHQQDAADLGNASPATP